MQECAGGLRGGFPSSVDSHSSSVLAAWLAVGALCPVICSAALCFVRTVFMEDLRNMALVVPVTGAAKPVFI